MRERGWQRGWETERLTFESKVFERTARRRPLPWITYFFYCILLLFLPREAETPVPPSLHRRHHPLLRCETFANVLGLKNLSALKLIRRSASASYLNTSTLSHPLTPSSNPQLALRFNRTENFESLAARVNHGRIGDSGYRGAGIVALNMESILMFLL